jgi:hypothetical protein
VALVVADTADDDLGIALRKQRTELRDQQFAAYQQKWNPMPYEPMTQEQASEVIRKQWPEVNVQPKTVYGTGSGGSEEAIANAKELQREIEQQAPWLTPAQVRARLDAALEAKRQIAAAEVKRRAAGNLGL